MVASKQEEIPFYRGIGRQRGRIFCAIARVISRTAFPSLRNYIVPAANRVMVDLLEFALPEIADVVSGRKILKTAAKSVGRQTLRKQLRSGSKQTSVSKVAPTKSAKQSSRSRTDLSTSISP